MPGATEPHSARRALEAFVSRLIQSVARGPLIKGFPTKTVKRIDLGRLRVASADAPERLVEALIGSSGQLLLRFEHFAANGAVGDESRALFSTLKSKLQREAQMVLRETGLRTLWLAYPILFVPNPGGDASDFLLAPLFLWPLRIMVSDLREGEIVLARDKDGGAPRFNRVAAAWIRRYLDFAPAEPSAGDIREIDSVEAVEAACAGLAASFSPPLTVSLTGRVTDIPRREELLGQTSPALLNSGLIGLVQWENQELIQDLERLLTMERLEGAANDFLCDPGPKSTAAVAPPEEGDRYLITDTDASQERAVWMARGEQGVVVHGPPGTGKSQVIVNIVADALAHHQTVLVVCQKKAALDVVAARLRGRGLGDLCLQIDDVESDRARVIEALKTQRRPEAGAFEQERRSLAERITRVETELDAYRHALFDLRQSHGLSYRRMLGRIASLGSQVSDAEVPDGLRPLVSGLRYAEVQRLGRLFEELETVYAQARPTESPWRYARPEVGGAPGERAAIGKTLAILHTAARAADGSATARGVAGVEIRGDLEVVADAAVKVRRGLSDLRSIHRRPPKRTGQRSRTPLVDGRLRAAVASLTTLVRWQGSVVRGLVPEYYLARRRFRQVLREHPWLASSRGTEMLEQITQRARMVHAVCRALTLCGDWLEKGRLLEIEDAARRAEPVAPTAEELLEWLPALPSLCRYRAMVTGLAAFERQLLDILLQGGVSDQWAVRIELAALSSWVRTAEQESPVLRAMVPELYEARRAELQTVLARKRELEAKAIASAWGDKWERTDLRWRQGLATRGRASRRLREIVEAWRPGLMVMRPCWLVTPGTVSQLFPLELGLFDAVVFDEASQCPPEYAIPSLYRGRRAVVAGDAKQLPPTMFFKSTFDFEEEGEEDSPQEATESGEILNRHAYAVATGAEDLLALAQARLPEAHLNVHYRSRDPRLIAFSNAAFYGNQLQTPQGAAPILADGGPALSLVRVDGRYSRSRINEREAEAVVHCIRSLWGGAGPAPTLGVVTFNEPQQQRILDLLDEAARKDPAFGARYTQELARQVDGQDVGFFVKNLEAVQGDERDVMLFSTTYGPQDDRPFSRAFLGPLNQTGGERRLNVAITRAKLWVRIFTSLPIEQVADALTGSGVPARGGLGRSMLQLYLAYAEAVTRGAEDVATVTLERALGISGYVADPAESLGLEESEFELEVADQLRRRFRYRVDPQVGSGAFRIDLGVRHPDDLAAYVLGIECDGRAYHSAPSARAYDLWRQRILEERGWGIHRVWSTAWRQDPERELEKIEGVIRERLAASRRDEGRRSGVSREMGHDDAPSERDAETSKATDMEEGARGPDTVETVRRRSTVPEVETRSLRGPGKESPLTPSPTQGTFSKPRPAMPAPRPNASADRTRTSHPTDQVTMAIARQLPPVAWKCGKCAEGMQLWMGRYGPFLKCTAPVCGQNVSVEPGFLAKALQELGVTCAVCSARAVAARGPFGNFIGCSDYPRCKARRSWLDLRDQLRREA